MAGTDFPEHVVGRGRLHFVDLTEILLPIVLVLPKFACVMAGADFPEHVFGRGQLLLHALLLPHRFLRPHLRYPPTLTERPNRPSKSAAHRDKSREWNASKQKWNLC